MKQFAPAAVVLLCLACVATAGSAPQSIRSGWVGVDMSSRYDFSMLEPMAAHGMNTVLLALEHHSDDEMLETFDRWQRRTDALGLRVFCGVMLWNKGDLDRFPLDRTFADARGKAMRRTPCPNDDGFWQRRVTDLYMRIAKWSRDRANVDGILLDAELYGGDVGTYRSACFCDPCRREVAAEMGIDESALGLEGEEAVAAYTSASEAIVARRKKQTRIAVHAENPRLILAAYDVDGSPVPFYRGLIRAWGTPERPFLVCSAGTYQTGYTTTLQPDRIEQCRAWGLHVEWLGGLWTKRIPHENLAENLYYMARDTRGYWLYHMRSFSTPVPSAARLPGLGALAYWKQIKRAHREIDAWQQSRGRHDSTLTIRPFQTAPPGVDTTRHRPVKLAAGDDPPDDLPGFLLRHTEQLFHIAADRGDTVSLTLHFDSAHPTKKKMDAAAIVVVDPAGRVVLHDAFRRSDFGDDRGPHGRFVGSRDVTFEAGQAGTYSLFVKSVYYAFNISASSHPWIASMGYPNGTNYTRVDYPEHLFLVTRAGAANARIDVTCTPMNRPGTITLRDSDGRTLASGQIQGDPRAKHRGSLTLEFKPGAGPQVVRMTFEPAGRMRDTNLYPGDGFTPWIGATADAPFPAEAH
ncbi:MAG: hypothetical protein CMJ18_21820 [Phycisphaeraceae bacterium]|nr:hypothetical protein [Phycisphaeraceae bacterium]